MTQEFFDVYGCRLCERQVATENGINKDYMCCDQPMGLVRENAEFVKIDSADWPSEKLVASVSDKLEFTGNDYTARTILSTPAMEVRVLSFKSGQETIYEKAESDLSLFVTEGSGFMALGYDDIEISKSSVVVVPRGMLWGIKNTNSSPLVVLQTLNGSKYFV